MKKAKIKRRRPRKTSIECYSPRRKAEFLLNNAINASDYRRARKEVRRLGLDPDSISHQPPHN